MSENKMKTYTHLVDKQFKLNKKRIFLCVLGIFIGVVILTFSFLYFRYISLNNLKNTENSYGRWVVAYNLDRNYDYKLNVLENNVLVKDFGIIQSENFEKIIKGKEVTIKYLGFNENITNNILKDALKSKHIDKYFPLKENQILMNENAKALGLSAMDKISLGNKTYEIVGFFESNSRDDSIEVIGNMNKQVKDSNLTAYVQVKGNSSTILKNIESITKNIGISTTVTQLYNNQINLQSIDQNTNNQEFSVEINKLYLGDAYKISGSGSKEINIFEALIIATIVIVVLLMNIILVYFLTKERSKVFSILKCIGATPKQIYAIVIKELVIIAILAIPSGIILGYMSFCGIINILFKIDTSFWNASLLSDISWQIICLLIILSLFMLFVAGMISTVALKNKSIINKTKISFKAIRVKRKTTKLLRKTLGVKGEFLYKDLRAKPVAFIFITVILVFIISSIVISTNLLSVYSQKEKNNLRFKKDIEVSLGTDVKDENIYNIFNSLNTQRQSFIKLLDKVDAKEITSVVQISMPDNTLVSISKQNSKALKDCINSSINIYVYNDEAFKAIENYADTNNKVLDTNSDEGVVLVNPSVNNGNINKENFYENAKIGDFLNIEILKNNEGETNNQTNTNNIRAKILGYISNENIIDTSIKTDSSVDIIVSKEFIQKHYKELFVNLNSLVPIEQKFEFNILGNDIEKQEKSNKIENYIAIYTNGYIKDNITQMKNLNTTIEVIWYIVYLGIGIIALGSIIFIFINKLIAINRRNKSFGIIIALGGENILIKQILWLETILEIVISVVVSIPLSYIILNLLESFLFIDSISNIENLRFWIVMLVAIAFIIILLVIITLIAIRNTSKLNITDMMKNEE